MGLIVLEYNQNYHELHKFLQRRRDILNDRINLIRQIYFLRSFPKPSSDWKHNDELIVGIGGISRGSSPKLGRSRDKGLRLPKYRIRQRVRDNPQSRNSFPALDPETAGRSAIGADAVPPFRLLTAIFVLKRASL